MAEFILSAFADEYSPNFDEQLEGLKKNGVGFMEIRGVDGKNISDLTEDEMKAVREKLDKAGIGISSIGSPIGKIKISDPFEPHLDKLRNCIRAAKILGTKNIRIFSFYMPEGVTREEARPEVMKRLAAMLEIAKAEGITLCHENEKGIYGDIADRCLDILQNFPSIKAVYDPANFLQCGEDTIRAWELLEPYIAYMHIKDVREDGVVVPAGQGHGRIHELLERYEKIGGQVLTLEPHLAVFKGLDALENGEKTKIGEFEYPSQRDAFDAAVNALKGLL